MRWTLTILLMSLAKVTPLLGLSWEPLLLPPREFLLMIPKKKTCFLKLTTYIPGNNSERNLDFFFPYPGEATGPAAAGCSCGMRGNRSPWTGGAADWTAWQQERRCLLGGPSPSSRTTPRSPSFGRPAGPAPPSGVWWGTKSNKCEVAKGSILLEPENPWRLKGLSKLGLWRVCDFYIYLTWFEHSEHASVQQFLH